MTAPKKTATKTAAAKPKFLVVEDTLKCQTENGELTLALKVKFGTVRKLMKVGGDQTAEMEFFMEHVLDPKVVEALDELDSAEAAAILGEFGEALAKRMGASLGESEGSSDS